MVVVEVLIAPQRSINAVTLVTRGLVSLFIPRPHSRQASSRYKRKMLRL